MKQIWITAAVLSAACNRSANLAEQGEREAEAERLGQTKSALCGDGVWEPLSPEECDLSPGSTSEACSSDCLVQDFPLQEPVVSDGVSERRLGSSQHVAAVGVGNLAVVFTQLDAAIAGETEEEETTEPLPQVNAQLLDRDGTRLSEVSLSQGLELSFLSNPSVAALAGGAYVAAFGAFDADADELGIALRRFDAEGDVGEPEIANATTPGRQYDPDVLSVDPGSLTETGEHLVVAWVDESNAATAPDVRYRRFEPGLRPLGAEQTLAETDAVEASVTLARFGESWAAAWRSVELDATETLRVSAPELELDWSIAGNARSSAEARPALVALDEQRLLVAFTVGTTPAGHDLPDTSRLRVALLHPDNAGEVSTCDPGPSSGTFAEEVVEQNHPALVVREDETESGFRATLAWRTSRVLGNDLGEELWQRTVMWPSTVNDCTELLYDDPVPLPAEEDARVADQERPRLVADKGLLVATWEDYGGNVANLEVTPDLVVQLSPFETFCSVEDPCGVGEGDCASDEECEGELTCGYQNGAAFGLRPDVNACIPCGDGNLDPGEECDEVIETPDCNANCTFPFCGDGNVNLNLGEECDNGTPEMDSFECNANCTPAECGDGYVNAAFLEECEPEQADTNDANCDSDCTLPVCGDGILNPSFGELCELSDPQCPLDCGLGVCPDGVCVRLESKLQNVAVNDAEIRTQMRITNLSGQTLDLTEYSLRYWFTDPSTAPWDLVVYWDVESVVEEQVAVTPVTPALVNANRVVTVPLEGTLGPDGAELYLDFSWRHQGWWPPLWEDNDYSYLPVTDYTENTTITLYRNGELVWGEEPPPVPVCGNGTVEGTEECDDAGESSSCDANCTSASCGDGTVNATAGEACDPGSDPDCLADCSGFATCTDPATCLHALYHLYSDDLPGDQQIRFVLQLVNNSPSDVPLDQVTVRYWFTKEPAGVLVPACDWAAIDCVNVNPLTHGAISPSVPGADYFWESSFTSGAGTLSNGESSGFVLLRAQTAEWEVFQEPGDHSFIDGQFSPGVTTAITLYLNGDLVWGEEP